MHVFAGHHLSPHRHRESRHNSNASDRSSSTVTGNRNVPYVPIPAPGNDTPGGFFASPYTSGPNSRSNSRHRREDSGASSSREDLAGDGGTRSRRGSLTSLAPTMGSGSSGRREHGARGGAYRKARELEEFEVRDDMVAWRLPGAVT